MDLSRDYNLYAVFMKVCEIKSYSKVAEELGYSAHQSISDKMVTLAKQLGVKTLFVRHSRGVVPTAEALKLYDQVKASFNSLSMVEDDIKEFTENSSAVINVVIPATVASIILSEFFKQFHMDFPNIKFKLFNRAKQENFDLLAQGKVDFVVDFDHVCKKYGLQVYDLFYAELVFIASKKYLQDNGIKDKIGNDVLARNPIIAQEEALNYYHENSSNIIVPFITVANTESIFNMVQQCVGIGLYYKQLLNKFNDENIIALKIAEEKTKPLKIVCGHRKDSLTKSRKIFLTELLKFFNTQKF